jgi:hypothetical protein
MRRSLQFETLEQRVTMSTGLAHPGVAVAAQKFVPIPGNLTGGSSRLLTGTNIVLVGGLSGKLGRVQFRAFANLEVSGDNLLNGELHLSNSQGTLLVNLEPGKLVNHGKGEQLKVVMIVGQCTGPYAAVEGASGTATLKLTSSKSPTNAAENLKLLDWSKQYDFILFLTSGELKSDRVLEWQPEF